MMGLASANAAGGGAAKPKGDGQKRLSSAESYVVVPPLLATVSKEFTATGILSVDVALDIPDAKMRASANANMPRVRDALRAALASYASTGYEAGKVPDATRLHRLLQRSVDRAMEAPGASVLFVTLMVRRIR